MNIVSSGTMKKVINGMSWNRFMSIGIILHVWHYQFHIVGRSK